jgi:ribosome-binding ATPase YchF (GTP1/OBG family)
VQVDVADDKEIATADVIAASPDSRPDLILQDLDFVETRLGRNPAEPERAALLKLKAKLEADGFVSEAVLAPEETQALAVHTCFLTSKPVVVATADELAKPELLVLRAYAASGHLSFLTVGGKENRAWMIRAGTTAWDAAGAIHSDIQKGFIRAEIISYADFGEHGGETGAKRAGKQRLEGKTYVMQDYDVVNFRFNK